MSKKQWRYNNRHKFMALSDNRHHRSAASAGPAGRISMNPITLHRCLLMIPEIKSRKPFVLAISPRRSLGVGLGASITRKGLRVSREQWGKSRRWPHQRSHPTGFRSGEGIDSWNRFVVVTMTTQTFVHLTELPVRLRCLIFTFLQANIGRQRNSEKRAEP